MIAALFVERGGVYWDLPGVDPWDETRDARKYAGPWPVVAHPPCERWCKPLAMVNQTRYGHKVGDDGGCFDRALRFVRFYGGVLEHPAHSAAWDWFCLPRPKRGQWLGEPARQHTRILRAGMAWVAEVSQAAYGHRARKLTWLYYVGAERPPELDWSRPEPTATVSWLPNTKAVRPRLSKKEAKATPVPFRDLLLSIARSAIREGGAR